MHRLQHVHTIVLSALVLLLIGPCAAAADPGFVRIDPDTGLFTSGGSPFALISVTYVQCEPGRPGMNAGPIQVLGFDLPRIREDFRHMREVGVRAIYMRIGAGLFFTPDGEWRKVPDPFVGLWDNAGEHAAMVKKLEEAEARGIGPFVHTYEVFDYLLDCAEAEGILVVPMILDTWSVPRKYEQHDLMTAFVREETWKASIAEWQRIVARYRDRKVIAGWLIEGETLHLMPWHDERWFFMRGDGPKLELGQSLIEGRDPELRKLFQDFLRQRHGTIENLRAAWGHGYDRTQPEYDPNGVPRYPYVSGVFDAYEDFDDVPLPTVERAKDEEGPGTGANFPWWLNVPFDPMWVDFAYFKDWLYTTRLNELFAGLREADPNHLIFHSAALDSVAIWHPFFAPWDHGALHADVLLHGGGYTEAVKKPDLHLDQYETVLERYQTVGPYRPWTTRGIPRAFGMGEGGFGLESNSPAAKTTVIPETDETFWDAALLFDNFGSGAAYANIWDWSGIVGATVENPELHDHHLTAMLRELDRALQVDTFTRGRDTRVLILANGPALHSLVKEADYSNITILSSALAAAHVDFDIGTTDCIAFEGVGEGVDLAQYDCIFMPQLMPLPERTMSPFAPLSEGAAIWPMLEAWLDAKPRRVLCAGPMLAPNRLEDVVDGRPFRPLRAGGPLDAYFNAPDFEAETHPKIAVPGEYLPKAVQRVLGPVIPYAYAKIQEKLTLHRPLHETVSFPVNNLPVRGVGDPRSSYLWDGEAVTYASKVARDNGSLVYHFGFPLGLSWMYSHDPELRGGRLNIKVDASELAALYQPMLEEAGVSSYVADPSVQVYVSDNGKVVLVRDRAGRGSTGTVAVRSPAFRGHRYAGAEGGGDSDRLVVQLRPGAWSVLFCEECGEHSL